MKKNDVKNDSRKDNNLMVKIATFIVDKRRAFYLIFALALVLCVISIPKVQVNNDISSYLPEETETRRGLTLMDDEFITYDTEKIMVTTITTETAEKLKDKLEKVDGVKEVEFENDDDHYKDSAALFTVTLSVRDDLDRELEIVNEKYGMSPCSVAVGTAFARGSFQIEELCKIADDRMYEDKRRKHNCR
mgnify:CR=1 FL=1